MYGQGNEEIYEENLFIVVELNWVTNWSWKAVCNLHFLELYTK